MKKPPILEGPAALRAILEGLRERCAYEADEEQALAEQRGDRGQAAAARWIGKHVRAIDVDVWLEAWLLEREGKPS